MTDPNKQQIVLMRKNGLTPNNYYVLKETETELEILCKYDCKRKVLKKLNEAVDFVYIKVTKDKYEYPLEMADSVSELARITGEHVTTIYHNINRKNGKYKKVDLRGV